MMKNNGPDYEPATIEIGEVHIYKKGKVYFSICKECGYEIKSVIGFKEICTTCDEKKNPDKYSIIQ